MESDPYNEGYCEGYGSGDDRCPYQRGTLEFQAWTNGYYEGAEDLAAEEAEEQDDD